MKKLFTTAFLAFAIYANAQTSAAPKTDLAKAPTTQTEYVYLTEGLNSQTPIMDGYRLEPVLTKNVMGKYKVEARQLKEAENTKALSIVITETKNNKSHFAVIPVNNKELGRKNTIDVDSNFPTEIKNVYHIVLELLLSEYISK